MTANTVPQSQTNSTANEHNQDTAETGIGPMTKQWMNSAADASTRIACSTAKHFGTAIRWAMNYGRRRANDNAISQSRMQLGERAYELLRGDATIRKQIAAIDYRLENVREGEGSSPQLEAERRGLICRLADSLDNEPSMQAMIDDLVEARQSRMQLEQTLRRQKRQLLPRNRTVQSRIAAGYVISAIAPMSLLAVLLPLWGTDRVAADPPVEVSIVSHPQDQPPATAGTMGGSSAAVEREEPKSSPAAKPSPRPNTTATRPAPRQTKPAARPAKPQAPPAKPQARSSATQTRTASTTAARPAPSTAQQQASRSTSVATTPSKPTPQPKPARPKTIAAKFNTNGYSNPELFRRIYEGTLEETTYDDGQLAAYLQPFLETFFQSKEAPVSRYAYAKVSRHMATQALTQFFIGMARSRRGGIQSSKKTTFNIVGNLRNGRADARLFYSRHGCDSLVARKFFNNVERYIRKLSNPSR